MAKEIFVELGPWPRGIDNLSKDTAVDSTRVGGTLREAENVDIRKDGWTSRRLGYTLGITLTDPHSLHNASGTLVCQDSGSLLALDVGADASAVLRSGLSTSRYLSYCDFAGDTWWTNGEICRRISSGADTFWGIRSPNPPILAATIGNLHAGRYLIALTHEASDGVESGAREAAEIELDSTGGILLAGLGDDPDAAYTNIYATQVNGETLEFIARIASSETSYTLRSVAQAADQLRTLHMSPPPPGQLCAAFNGHLLIASGSAVFWSQPHAPHLFKLSTDLQLFSSRITAMLPVEDGIYFSAGGKMLFAQGNVLGEQVIRTVDGEEAVEGASALEPGWKIPSLEYSDGMVAIWVGSRGPVVGLPSGRVVHLVAKQIKTNRYTRGAMLVREERDLHQIITSLRETKFTSRLGVGDVATATVIRAGVTE